jgi:hypothetical protein
MMRRETNTTSWLVPWASVGGEIAAAGTSAKVRHVSRGMNRVLTLVFVVFSCALSACFGGTEARPESLGALPVGGTVLGIIWQENSGTLRRLERVTLRPTSGPVPIGHDGAVWRFSPDQSQLALAGGEPLEIRIVDVLHMELEAVVPLPRNLVPPPGEGQVVALAWPRARRILALLEWGAWQHALVVVDPVARRIVSSEPIEGTLVAQAPVRGGLALLLAPPARIGPSRLLVVDGSGEGRSIPLAELAAGLEMIDAHRAVSRVDLPGLAVNPAGTRALVVPAEGRVAEIDLAAGQVVYRTARVPVSLLGRLRNWLEPAAEAKAREGPERQAAWLWGDFVAVSGQDAQRLGGQDQERTTAGGLALIDIRNWRKRTLDERATQFSFSGGTLLAYGTTWNSETQKTTGMGLSGYGMDGRKRFHLFADAPVYFLQTSGPYAYVWRGTSVPPAVVDLQSGQIVRTLDRYRKDLPVLLASAQCDCGSTSLGFAASAS